MLAYFAIGVYRSKLSEESANTTNNYRPSNSLIKNVDVLVRMGKLVGSMSCHWICLISLYTLD